MSERESPSSLIRAFTVAIDWGLDLAISCHQILFIPLSLFSVLTPGSGSLSCPAFGARVSYLFSLFPLARISKRLPAAFNPPSPLFSSLSRRTKVRIVSQLQDTRLHSAAHSLAAACGSIRCNGCESCTSLAPKARVARQKVAGRSFVLYETEKDSERPIFGIGAFFSLLFSLLLCDDGCSVSHLLRRSN